MRWASCLSESRDLTAAVDAAADTIDEQLDGDAHLVVCFVSPHHDDRLDELPGALRERFPDAVLLGSTGDGVIGDGREIERAPALSLTAATLPSVGIVPFHYGVGQAPRGPAGWRHRLGITPEHQPAFLLMPDPYTCDVRSLLSGLDAAFPGAPKIGGLASGGRHPGGNGLLMEDRLHRDGLVGVALFGDISVSCVVAQGCRPVGPDMVVTRAERNLLLALDGGKAVDALDRVFSQLKPAERELFQRAPMVGLLTEGSPAHPRAGDYLVRDVVGLDRGAGAVGVGALLDGVTRMRFHLRDAAASAEELDALLSQHHRDHTERPSGALLFSCMGRGRGLYGAPDHDSRAFRRHLGPAPLGGFFCSGEIGPVHQTTHLHGYTSAFGIFRPRGWN